MSFTKRFFICLSAAVVLLTPFTIFSSALSVDTPIYHLPIDNNFPTVTSYFYGANTAIIDYQGLSNVWYRIIFNNTMYNVSLYYDTNYWWLNFEFCGTSFSNVNGATGIIYEARFGTSYISNRSYNLTYSEIATVDHSASKRLVTPIYINCCSCPIYVGSPTVDLSHCDFNSYYPFVNVSSGSDSRIDQVLNNQNDILSKQDQAQTEAQSRFEAAESAAQSRNDDIINAGDDVTVSTIDNWVGGDDGLASKLDKYASTLSENLSIFSSNARENQSGLNAAGSFLRSFNSVFPTGIIAAILCFMIILIAVKVIGR